VPRSSRRRFFQDGLTLVGLGLLAGCGLPPPWLPPAIEVPRIGFLTPTLPPPRLETFQHALHDLGYEEGHNLLIEYRIAEREDLLPALADDLVRLGVRLIVVGNTAATQVARKVTGSIPIIMAASSDVDRLGIVASLARPGGNVTGLTTQFNEVSAKGLDLLKEAIPPLAQVAVIWHPATPAHPAAVRDWETAVRVLGMEFLAVPVDGEDDLTSAFSTMAAWGAGAVFVPAGGLFSLKRQEIVDAALRHGLPTMFGGNDYVKAGGLMSYGPNVAEMFRRAATYVDKILKGAAPADLPVERPILFDLSVNVSTARALGLSLPQSILQQVTEFIE